MSLEIIVMNLNYIYILGFNATTVQNILAKYLRTMRHVMYFLISLLVLTNQLLQLMQKNFIQDDHM